MGKALYRQYRSASFDEVIGQDHITTTLKNSLKNGSINHAYLLTGPRGVGKTSVARILAYRVNNLPYADDSNHLDILEIDAASNRRIDEIRDLREKVHIAPTSAKYKVYIVDEVHMLTREAFNALLKTLEEPPSHVIFILATTEVHKLPETIVSRCLRLTFRPISQTDIAKHLEYIADKEDIKVSEAALKLIAEHGEGSFRDSISLLDQIKNIAEKIDVPDVEQALGIAPQKIVDNIIASVKSRGPAQLDEYLTQAYLHGSSVNVLCKQIAQALRSSLLAGKPALAKNEVLTLLKALVDVSVSPRPKTSLELALLGVLLSSSVSEVQEPASQPPQSAKAPQEVNIEIDMSEINPPVVIDNIVAELPSLPKNAQTESEMWQNVLDRLKNQYNTLYGIARMAEAEYENNTLTLVFKFSFHYKRINDQKNKAVLVSVVRELGHEGIEIKAVLQENEKKLPARNAQKAKSEEKTISTINDIFGSSEMLES